VPGAATGLADVSVGDLQPLEVLGPRQHPLQQLAVVGLDLLALAQGAARRRHPRRQPVPDRLEATEPEGTRLAGRGRHRSVDLQPREGLYHEGRELSLEPADLAAQLNSGEPLVAPNAKLDPGVTLQQIRHNPSECRSPRRSRRWLELRAYP
jgi:hypothetical protein